MRIASVVVFLFLFPSTSFATDFDDISEFFSGGDKCSTRRPKVSRCSDHTFVFIGEKASCKGKCYKTNKCDGKEIAPPLSCPGKYCRRATARGTLIEETCVKAPKRYGIKVREKQKDGSYKEVLRTKTKYTCVWDIEVTEGRSWCVKVKN